MHLVPVAHLSGAFIPLELLPMPIDLAFTHGVGLDPDRARRAAAAGHGAERNREVVS